MPGTIHFLDRLPKPAARWSRLFALAVIVGVLGGISASILDWGLERGSRLLIERVAPDFGGPHILDFRLWVLLLPVLGGLVSGLVVQLLFREPFEHGTDIYVRAFHHKMGALPLKGPLVKALAAIGVIACGGSTGPEGPIAALGAAWGSTIGRITRLSPRERRILLVAGCGAGVGAIFRCPLGGALFATSVLYREEEFEADSIVPAFVASVLGYSTFIEILGQQSSMLAPFQGRSLSFNSALELIPYAMLGPLCGLASIFLGYCLQIAGQARDSDALSGVPCWLKPAIGGLATGGIACLLPQVMDSRYELMHNAMGGFDGLSVNGWWWVCLFAAVVVGKSIATAFTVGSGGSGGVLGPSVFIGGAVGAFLGALLNAVYPQLFEANPQLRQALIPVGMGGVLAAGMRTPLAAIVMVSEMTGSYGLIVPLMLVCMSSYVVGRFKGLNAEQVRSVSESPAHAGDAVVHLLESWKVRDVMETQWEATVSPSAPLPEMIRQIQPGTRPVFAVAQNDRLLGVVSVADIHRIMDQPGLSEAVIAMDMMTDELTTIGPDEEVYTALSTLAESGHDVLPVVSTGSGGRWLGMMTRQRVFEALQRSITQLQELMLREHAGLAAIRREGAIQQLVMGVSPANKQMIQRLFVPMDVVGRSLRGSDFRSRYGAQVIGIEEPDGTIRCPPDLDAPLQTGQRLLAIVGPEGLKESLPP